MCSIFLIVYKMSNQFSSSSSPPPPNERRLLFLIRLLLLSPPELRLLFLVTPPTMTVAVPPLSGSSGFDFMDVEASNTPLLPSLLFVLLVGFLNLIRLSSSFVASGLRLTVGMLAASALTCSETFTLVR